jgi:hypothetical protein
MVNASTLPDAGAWFKTPVATTMKNGVRGAFVVTCHLAPAMPASVLDHSKNKGWAEPTVMARAVCLNSPVPDTVCMLV